MLELIRRARDVGTYHGTPPGGLMHLRQRAFVFLLLTAPLLCAPVPYSAPSGDLNLDGSVDVADLQCEILLFQALALVVPGAPDQCQSTADCVAVLGPGVTCRGGFNKSTRCLPSCLSSQVPLGEDAGVLCQDDEEDSESCLGTTQVRSADLNCDGVLSNVDIVFLVAVLMNAIGEPDSADHDGDGKLNFCDDDSDGDGDPDVTDCAVLDESVSQLTTEVCNGKDENCNDKIDEFLGEVTCGVGICVHNEPACVDGAPGACDPLAGAEDEQCNGIDDDCDGKVDNGTGDFLCVDFLGVPHGNSLACVNGSCAITACDGGWFDLNGLLADGCECNEDAPDVVNGSCGAAVDLGVLADTPVAQVFVGSNEPTGQGDWYRFTAKDADEGFAESFHVKAQFLKNPGDTFVFDLHWGSCEASHRICTGSTVVEWFTDFFQAGATDSTPAIPGPGVKGGGENNCRLDPNHTLTPGNFSDDTSASSHSCADNTAQFFLRVYVAPGKKPTCQPYKIEITNGL